MKNIFIISMALMTLLSCSDQNKFDAKLNEEVPNFELDNVDGGVYELKNDEGNVVVIFVFGSSCPLCIGAGPSIQTSLSEAYADSANYSIIGIDQWNGSKSQVRSFRGQTGIDFPLLIKGANVASSLNSTFDRLLVIDKEGVLRFRGSQSARNDINNVMNIVNELLNE